MKRLFVAIELAAAAREAIAGEQRRLQRAAAGSGSAMKWVDPRHLHLTLAFLGEVAAAEAEALERAMQRPFTVPPFWLAFERVGVFPPAGPPRVLWLGVGEGAEALIAVQRQVAARVEAVGIPIERRPFQPHLTLARWRTSRPGDRRWVLALDRPDRVARLAVETVALIHSRLSPGGPSYTTLCRAPLVDPAPPPLQSS